MIVFNDLGYLFNVIKVPERKAHTNENDQWHLVLYVPNNERLVER